MFTYLKASRTEENMTANSEAQNPSADTEQRNFPSTYKLTCPKCGKNDFKVLGTKGAKGASIGIGMAFGAIGNLIASSSSKDEVSVQPVQYQCKSCKNKFESLPLNAEPDEILSAPCTITFTRLSSFVGMAVVQGVWLNGVKAGTIDNGKTITFQTFTKHNTIFVTDQYGVVINEAYHFEAQSGGQQSINFKRKFV